MKGKVRRIHFVGIGGSGMSGIAEVLVNLGYPERQAMRAVADVTKARGRERSSFEVVLREALSRLGRA